MKSSRNPPSTPLPPPTIGTLSSATPTLLLVTLPSFAPAAVPVSFAAETLLFLAARFSFPATTTVGDPGGGRLNRSLVV